MSTVDTKDRILDAAEKLFADNGFSETSLRSITAEAQVNLAAVNYHFGSKEGLLQPLVHRLLAPINRDRIERLDALEARQGSRPVPLEDILEAFLAPLLERHERHEPRRLMRLMARLYADAGADLGQFFRAEFEEVLRRFPPALRRSLDTDCGEEILESGVLFMVGSMVHAAGHPVSAAAVEHGCRGDRELLLRRLITYAAAGLRALVAEASTPSPEVSP